MRLKSSCLLLCTCLALPSLEAQRRQTRPIEENQRGGFDKISMIGADYANPQTLRRYWETRFLQQGRFPDVLLIKAYATRADYDRDHANANYGEVWPDQIKQLYGKARHRPLQTISEILAIGPNVVLRSVAGTDISRSVLHGNDPTLFDVGSVHCEILQVSFEGSLMSPLNVQFFLRTESLPTRAQAEAITREVQARVHYREIEVYMQPGVWFIGRGGFRLWYPFSNDAHPPTWEEAGKQNAVQCFGSGDKLYCSSRQNPSF